MDNIIPSTSSSIGRKTTALEQTILQINAAEQKLQTLIQEEKNVQTYVTNEIEANDIAEMLGFI